MLGFSPLPIRCFIFLCLFHINVLIRAISEPKLVNALASSGIRPESTTLQVDIRHKRQDAWNSKDIFLCEEDDEDSMGYSLTCDKMHICKMTTFSPSGVKMFKAVLDLDTLTDNCSRAYNPFYGTQAGRSAANRPNLPFVMTQVDISELVLWDTNFTRFPPNYFCKLTNTTTLTLQSNFFEGSRDLGLTAQCDIPQCCLCGLENLVLTRSEMQVLNNFSFCGLPSLRSLTLSSNAIAHVEVNAFATLHSLQGLDLQYNRLKELPANVFLPVRNLKRLNLMGNLLIEPSLKSLQLFSSLEELELSKNEISQIKGEDFNSLTSLKRLYLSGNNLMRLGDVMRSLTNLIVLDISVNCLSNSSELELGSMANLSRLILSVNNFASMSSLVLSAHAHVNVLAISGNKLTSIPAFIFLKHVRRIHLSNNTIRRVTAKDRDMFCNITLIESIDLSFNLIEDIASGAFDCAGVGNGLKSLNLKHNRLTDVSDVFPNTKIQELRLNENGIEALSLANMSPNIVTLDVSMNSITNFSGIHPSEAYANNNVAMKELILESNKISTISNAYFPETLELLHLGSNRLANFTVATLDDNTSASIILPANIKTVDLTFNGFEYMCSVFHVIGVNDNIPIFRLTGNPIRCPCEIEFGSAHDQKLRIYPFRYSTRCFSEESSENSILDTSKLYRADQFSCRPKHSKVASPCQCNLQSMYSTLCNMPCPHPCHCFLNSRFDTQFINCTHRNLNGVPETPSIKAAVNLYFSYNVLASIEPSSLKHYRSARELYFDHNRLADLHPAAFEDVPRVAILKLQANFLTQLPEGVFQNLTELVELDLSDNRIALLPAEVFGPLISLGVLRLDSNSLDSFPVWGLRDPQEGQLHVTLSRNPWLCKCGYVNQFRVWLQNFSSRVDDVSELFCTSVDGTVSQIPLISFNSSHCYDLSSAFSVFQNVPLWSSFLAVLLLLIVASVLLFVYRAEVQVLVYSRYGLRVFHHQKEVDDGDKTYDAFVAYSSFDEEFLVNDLLPGLEQIENPYRVCVHQRDFMVGAIITESILEAVEKSRRTLVILSEHFVKSGWCRFEFKSAHMKMLTDRCNRVIVIVLDAVPKDLDPEMQLYMKTNTYLKWGDRFFWQKLYFALPDIKPKPNIPEA